MKRRLIPFKGQYALPGGFVDYSEDPEVACLRELKEETGLIGSKPNLICVAGKPDRDPRNHRISIVYEVKVNPSDRLREEFKPPLHGQWCDMDEVMDTYDLAFDHKSILQKFINKKSQGKL